jgi:hypothetical protein
MSWRQCEVVVMLPGGKRYSTVVEAKSVYHAAALFHSQCVNGPPELERPKIDAETTVEVKPIFRVQVSKAIAWAVNQDSREGKKARQGR